MPQRDLLMPWRDALGNAAIALENAGAGRRAAREREPASCSRASASAGSSGRARWELSGGMRQRVAFIRTLLAEKAAACCWTSRSPHSMRSPGSSCRIGWWRRWHSEPRTVVLVSHDIEEALVVCDRVIVLSARPGRRVMETPGRMMRDSPELGAARARVLEALR